MNTLHLYSREFVLFLTVVRGKSVDRAVRIPDVRKRSVTVGCCDSLSHLCYLDTVWNTSADFVVRVLSSQLRVVRQSESGRKSDGRGGDAVIASLAPEIMRFAI